MKPYEEAHQIGQVFIEKTLYQGRYECDIGIQIGTDGRIWICIDGITVLRFSADPGACQKEHFRKIFQQRR